MLTPIAEDVWGFEKDLRLPGGVLLPSRSTIVRMPDGSVLVHSPLGFDDDAAKEIEALGEPKTIVAPSCIHFLFLRAAIERWPHARVLGPHGLEKKVSGLAYETLPAAGSIERLGDALAVQRIDGIPYITEHVFLHRPSRTLVCTDLVFNIHECTFGMQMFLRCVGAYRRIAQSRMWRFFTKDRAAAGEGARAILGWDFERVVPAHGDVFDDDARSRLRAALEERMEIGASAA